MSILHTIVAMCLFSPVQVAEASVIPPYSTSTAESIVRMAAEKYDVSGDEMWATTKCENPTLDPKQKSWIPDEDSWGNSQINLYWHPEVTKEQAQDPYFAADFMAKAFSEGRQRWWTCWRNIYLKK